MEMFDDNLLGDVAVAGLLELCGVPYTGCGPGELSLCQDKALTKKILAYEGIAYPRFAVFPKASASRPAATCACRCSSSRCAATRRSASTTRNRWCATPTG